MKVYVDELPKSCADCEWFTPNHCSKGGRNFCLLARMPFYNTEEERQVTRGQHKDSLSDFDCPLQSIADHDKQVRKEVCEEIEKWCDKNFNWVGDGTGYDGQDYSEMIGSNNTINKLRELLDQIQGETK